MGSAQRARRQIAGWLIDAKVSALERFFRAYWTDEYAGVYYRRLNLFLCTLEGHVMSRMMRSLGGLALCLALVGTNRLARGQDGPPIPKPTAEHELLTKDVGTWDATVKSWMGGPDSEPMVSEGVEVVKLLPGGLWTHSEFDGKFGGLEFHGCGQTGYDTKKKKYVGTWVDSMSTEIMMMEGDYDAATHTMTSYAKGTDSNGKLHETKMIAKHEGDDTRVLTMLMKSDDTKGEYAKLMEITYKRRAK